jgi:outer membrane protein assembly factor BamB
MRPIPRAVLLVCALASVTGMVACMPQDSGRGSDAPSGYRVTSCDGAPVAHASLSQPPATAPAAVYIGTGGFIGGQNNGIFALAAADGSLRWCARFALTQTYACPPTSYCPPPPIASVGAPLVAGGVVYVCVAGGPAGVTYAFDASDGALRWSRTTGCRLVAMPFGDDARPLLADGVLYSGAFGLAPADGAMRWQLPPPLAQETIGAVTDGVAYVYGEETISAVRLRDGVVTWTYTLDAPIGNRPAPYASHLYVGDIAGDSPPAVTHGLPDTYALDIRTGTVVWRAPTGIVASSSAVEANGQVYIGAENALNALDVSSGAFRWRVTVPHDGSVASTPLVANGLVYFVGDGAYAVEAVSGAVRWHNALGWDQSMVFDGPALRDNTLYLSRINGDGQSALYALDAASGAVRWQHAGFNPLTAPAV